MVGGGKLRRRVAFDVRAIASDGYGNEQSDFAEVFEVWARIKPQLGGERVMADRLTGIQAVIITVRYSPDTVLIEPGWRARDENGVVYNITNANNVDEKHQYIDVLAVSGEAA